MSMYLSNLPVQEKTAQHLHDTASMLLAAGFETTGFTLTTATYHILANSAILGRLRQELHAGIPCPEHIPSWQALSRFPYLSAIIKESLRLSLGASARLPRVNSESEITYANWTIPKGTAISMSHSDLHYEKSVFPEPKTFKPERWLEGSDSASKTMHRYLVPFSRGGRKCMGEK